MLLDRDRHDADKGNFVRRNVRQEAVNCDERPVPGIKASRTPLKQRDILL